MSTNLRLSSFSGVLLAAYFIPTWTLIAFRMMVSPIHSFYEQQNIAVAFFVSDYLHLAATGTVRAAWLLAELGNDRRTQSRTGSIVPAATQATNTHGRAAENQRRQGPRRGARYAFILSYGDICPD